MTERLYSCIMYVQAKPMRFYRARVFGQAPKFLPKIQALCLCRAPFAFPHFAGLRKMGKQKGNLHFPQIATCRNSKVSHKKNNHSREVTKMVYISLATVANSATVPSILQRSAKWQYLYFDRGGIKAFLGCSDWIKVFYRKEGLS